MPSFTDTAVSRGAPEEVWKLLYDPSRFPDWWAGMASVEPGRDGAFTMYPDGYPDFPMAQVLESDRDHGRVRVSCMVSDLRFDWHLEPRDADGGTVITVAVDIPEREARRLETQQDVIRASLRRLAELAAAETA